MVQAPALEQQAHQREGLGGIRVGVDHPIEQGRCQLEVAAIHGDLDRRQVNGRPALGDGGRGSGSTVPGRVSVDHVRDHPA